jgi:hypothetical protein
MPNSGAYIIACVNGPDGGEHEVPIAWAPEPEEARRAALGLEAFVRKEHMPAPTPRPGKKRRGRHWKAQFRRLVDDYLKSRSAAPPEPAWTWRDVLSVDVWSIGYPAADFPEQDSTLWDSMIKALDRLDPTGSPEAALRARARRLYAFASVVRFEPEEADAANNPLTPEHEAMLRVLAADPTRCRTVEQIALKGPIRNRETVGRLLRELAAAKFVHRPFGRPKGYALTQPGLSRASALSAAQTRR